MFSKAIYVSLFVFSLALQGHAHAGISPALGVKGTLTRSDVQRPSSNNPCGNTNPATTIDNSQTVTSDAQGNVKLNVTNFNPGADGSRKVTAQVSENGTGKDLQTATVSTNGDATPTNTGTQPLVVQLPKGAKCTGGQSGDICLLTFTTTSGFGNCVAVKQDNGAAGGNKGTANVAAGAAGAVKQGGNGTANAAGAGAAASQKMTAVKSSKSKTGGAQKGSMAKGGNSGKKGQGKKGQGKKGQGKKGQGKKGQGKKGQGKKGQGKKSKGGKGMGSGKGHKDVNNAAKGDMKKGTPNNAAMDQNAKASKPAGARAVRSIISSQRGVVKRAGSLSWIWA